LFASTLSSPYLLYLSLLCSFFTFPHISLSYIPFFTYLSSAIFTLGVRPLSRIEIKKDLNDIDSSLQSDTESIVSVASDDVLNSTYPVKPRRYPRQKQLQHHQQQQQLAEQRSKSLMVQKESDIDPNSIEETIDFLRVVEIAKPEIYEAEREREELEIKYHVREPPSLSLFVSPLLPHPR
jgi:hypothetical protein